MAAVPSVKENGASLTVSQRHAGTGAVVFIYLSEVGWARGWNSIQYLINAEIFPLRVRSLGTSIVMCIHFVNQYGNSKAAPQMLLALKPVGTFCFLCRDYLVWFILGMVFPTRNVGKSLEAMDAMFSLPWYVIGRRGAKLTQGMGSNAETYDKGDLEKTPIPGVLEERVENVESAGQNIEALAKPNKRT